MVRFRIHQISLRRFIAIVSSAILFGILIWVLNHILPYQNVWNRFYTEADIGTFFCEQTYMDKVVRQPMNTFSNFIYLLAAILILRRGWKDRTKKNRYNIISANPYYSLALGGILLYIFCASVFFHSSLIHFASEMDFSAVYSLSLFPMMYFTHRVWLLRIGVASNQRHPRSTRILIAVFTVAYLMLNFFLPPQIRDYAVLGIIITVILFGIIVEREDKGKTNHYYLTACAASILFAVMWFGFDVHKVFCNPESVIQPHSLWHFFSGVAVFYFYMYIRSEKNKL